MTPGNYGQPTPPPGTWTSTPPAAPNGVWPPPPTQGAALLVPFKYVPRRASSRDVSKASLSDFRQGMIQIVGDGLLISGKVVLRAEIRYPIFIIAVLISFLLGAVVYSVMEYGFRKDAQDQVPWSAIRLVQLAPLKNQACIVYDAPNYKGVIKTFTLGFALDPVSFPVFAQQMQQALPGRLTEGNLRNSVTPRVWIRLIVLLLIVIGSIIAAVTKHH